MSSAPSEFKSIYINALALELELPLFVFQDQSYNFVPSGSELTDQVAYRTLEELILRYEFTLEQLKAVIDYNIRHNKSITNNITNIQYLDKFSFNLSLALSPPFASAKKAFSPKEFVSLKDREYNIGRDSIGNLLLPNPTRNNTVERTTESPEAEDQSNYRPLARTSAFASVTSPFNNNNNKSTARNSSSKPASRSSSSVKIITPSEENSNRQSVPPQHTLSNSSHPFGMSTVQPAQVVNKGLFLGRVDNQIPLDFDRISETIKNNRQPILNANSLTVIFSVPSHENDKRIKWTVYPTCILQSAKHYHVECYTTLDEEAAPEILLGKDTDEYKAWQNSNEENIETNFAIPNLELQGLKYYYFGINATRFNPQKLNAIREGSMKVVTEKSVAREDPSPVSSSTVHPDVLAYMARMEQRMVDLITQQRANSPSIVIPRDNNNNNNNHSSAMALAKKKQAMSQDDEEDNEGDGSKKSKKLADDIQPFEGSSSVMFPQDSPKDWIINVIKELNLSTCNVTTLVANSVFEQQFAAFLNDCENVYNPRKSSKATNDFQIKGYKETIKTALRPWIYFDLVNGMDENAISQLIAAQTSLINSNFQLMQIAYNRHLPKNMQGDYAKLNAVLTQKEIGTVGRYLIETAHQRKNKGKSGNNDEVHDGYNRPRGRSNARSSSAGTFRKGFCTKCSQEGNRNQLYASCSKHGPASKSKSESGNASAAPRL